MVRHATDNDAIFTAPGLGGGELFLRDLRGREALSEISELVLTLETVIPGELDLDDLDGCVGRAAHVTFGTRERHWIHGLVRDVEALALPSASAAQAYRVTLVPEIWRATLTTRSRVFQQQTVPEIVRAVLEEHGIASGDGGVEFRLATRHPVREYTVQFQETDFAFVSRLMEYEGMFYLFEQGEHRARMVVGDSNSAFAPVPIPGGGALWYDPRGGVTDPSETVLAISRRRAAIPGHVHLREYNYRTPGNALSADALASENAHGNVVLYGEHFRDVADGKRVAKLRAEEIACTQERYAGATNVRALRAGQRFSLEQHPSAGYGREYVTLEVHHELVQGGVSDDERAAPAVRGYRNRFIALASDVPFRPARRTPRPVIAGLMHARVDGVNASIAAPIDEHGRYRVVLPFDSAGGAGGQATRWIRMAQSSSGPGYGLHLPLHVGTEVMLGHLDGDPDRPVIVGSVPNPETPSPVRADNATQSVLRTRSGIHLEFEDDA